MLHINNFLDKLKVSESRCSTNFVMPMADAKNLHSDITKLLLALHTLTSVQATQPKEDEVTEVVVKGDDW